MMRLEQPTGGSVTKRSVMKINGELIKRLKDMKHDSYLEIKTEFLFHSNKIEGSTFSMENLEKLLNDNIVVGNHSIDDVYETINSSKVFDFIIDTLEEKVTKKYIRECHQILTKNTKLSELGLSGTFKKIPNRISKSSLELSRPETVESDLELLLKEHESISTLEEIAIFHSKFEKIHPFQDGNGRVGRFLILKECLKNDLDLIAIDETLEVEYKKALGVSQMTNDFEPLFEVFRDLSELTDIKLKDHSYVLDYEEEMEM